MPGKSITEVTWLYRLNVTLRVLLALVGGFFLTSSIGALIALGADAAGLMPRAQGVHSMTALGFLIWCAATMWTFYEARLWVVLLVMLGGSVGLTGAAVWVRAALEGL